MTEFSPKHVITLVLRPFIHLELIFVCGMRQGIDFTHLLKSLLNKIGSVVEDQLPANVPLL
jgi:hypothetical protein